MKKTFKNYLGMEKKTEKLKNPVHAQEDDIRKMPIILKLTYKFNFKTSKQNFLLIGKAGFKLLVKK